MLSSMIIIIIIIIYKYSTQGHMSSSASISIKVVIIMAVGQALPSQFRPPNYFSFPKREFGSKREKRSFRAD